MDLEPSQAHPLSIGFFPPKYKMRSEHEMLTNMGTP